MKTNPIPVRLDALERRQLVQLKRLTKMSQSQIIRLGLGYALPLFISGQVNPMSLKGGGQ
jgi:hypothetical protein